MELSQLEVFLAVARERRFSRAAKKLYRTQSAVSQTIRKLEDELGEALFDRSSREGILTDAGRVLFEYAEKLINLRTEAAESLTELRELQKGKLVIAANEFTVLYLLPILAEFRRLHREEGQTVILVTHDPTVAAAADRAVTIRDGRVVADTPATVPA